MPGGSDPTVGIHNLAYPICYMPTYINKSSKSMGAFRCHFRDYPLLNSTNKARDVHEVGGRAQSALAAD